MRGVRGLLPGQLSAALWLDVELHGVSGASERRGAEAGGALWRSRSYRRHFRTNHLRCSSVEARLLLACVFTASSTGLPLSMFGMTGSEYALELLKQCRVSRPLSALERQRLDNLSRYAMKEPGLALLCDRLRNQTSELSFLYGSVEEIGQSHYDFEALSVAEFQLNKIMSSEAPSSKPRKAVDVVTVFPRLNERVKIKSLSDAPVALEDVVKMENDLKALVSITPNKDVKPFFLENVSSDIASDILQDLRESWRNFQTLSSFSLQDSLDFFDTIKADIGSMENFLRHALNTVPFDEQLTRIQEAERAAQLIPPLTVWD